MSSHTERAERRAEHKEPKNVTCQLCKKVYPINSECPVCNPEKEAPIEDGPTEQPEE